MRHHVVGLLALCASCTAISYHSSEPNPVWFHRNSPATIHVISGNSHCGGWWSGPHEITSAAHCYDGNFRLDGIKVDYVILDYKNDIMRIGTDVRHSPWLSTTQSTNDTVVHVVNERKGIVVTRVVSTGVNNVELEWTASPGWSGSPAINESGEVVCMVVAYFYGGGTKCVKVD